MQIRRVGFMVLALVITACGSSVPSAAPTLPPTTAPAQNVGVPVSVDGGAYLNVTPAQLVEMLKRKDFYFVNVHIPYEGELEQTDAFIPFEEVGPQRVSDYPTDKNAQIVLYCRSGRMSAIVAEELVLAGYANVWNLDGGFRAWEQVGYPVIQK